MPVFLKIITIVVCFSLMFFVIFSPDNAEVGANHNQSLDRLLEAIRIVESNDNQMAVGDDGKAIGAYQIWEIYWKDATDFDSSIGGTYQDCYDRDYADKIVKAYIKRYANKKRLGHEPTFEDIARIHNGGPNGYKKKSTIEYWKKVQNALQNLDR